MYIESLVLQNFQCFGAQRAVIDLDPGLTPFIGSNGAGKTAACQALRRLFGITADERTVRIEDFHVPAGETEAPQSRALVIEAILAFPELDDDHDGEGKDAVPEFFHRMAADDHGTLKCRIVLEATWEADGTVDGDLSAKLWVVRTFNETYGDDDRMALPGAERARIQMIYVPASRDGARQVTAFLRGRLWRAAQWSEQLRELVTISAKQVSDRFHSEGATATVEKALAQRWLQLHGAGTHSTLRFQPIEPDLTQLLRDTELLFEPDHAGVGRSARLLSDGQRSLLHMALTTAALDIETEVADGSLAGSFDMTSAHLPTLTLLAIEEPENNLAPFYLSRIISQILQVCRSPRAQAVLASHSASVLNRIDPASIRYFRLDTDADTATVRPITLPDDATEAGKYVREAVRAHPELYFAQFVVLGEGDTEELVIPRIAQARDVELDPSFVAMVPLGGRHTNHFWKLLTDLHIPFATLLDLDYGRAGAGSARLRDACRRLADNGVDVFAGLEGFATAEDLTDTMTTEQISAVMKYLRRFGVFFSSPLDLDMAMPPRPARAQPAAAGPAARCHQAEMTLPADDHVHSEWSWDAAGGSMERSCARAVDLGLPAIGFTEHVDRIRSVIPSAAEVPAGFPAIGPDGRFRAPPLDLAGYLDCLERCRSLFAGLRIVSGVEIGERHWFKAQIPALVANGAYERVLGSLHALLVGDEPWFVGTLLGPNAPTRLTPHMVMRSYLLEALRMIEADSSFTVLAHLDYPMRAWPQNAAPFDPRTLEDRYRSLAQGASIIVGGS